MKILGSDRSFVLIANVVLSFGFVVFSIVALVQRPNIDVAYVGFSLLLFFVGMVAMVAALAISISASRFKEISLAGVFFLGHGSSDKETRNLFLALLVLQIFASVTVASIAPFSSIVFAVLVPQMGFGLMGLHGALYGNFKQLP